MLPEGEIARIEAIEKNENNYVINAKVCNTIKLSDAESDKLWQVIEKYKEESVEHDNRGFIKAGEYLVMSNNKPYKCKATGINGEEEYSIYIILEEGSTVFDIVLVSDKKEKFHLLRS